ncbi:MAG: hypothetical protein [Microvirus sp.]|nr:MAG: hypothetical protein [Microvirus sp.]
MQKKQCSLCDKRDKLIPIIESILFDELNGEATHAIQLLQYILDKINDNAKKNTKPLQL